MHTRRAVTTWSVTLYNTSMCTLNDNGGIDIALTQIENNGPEPPKRVKS